MKIRKPPHVKAAANERKNTMQQQFEQLKSSRSLRLQEGMPVLWPKHEPGELKVSKITENVKNKKAYAYSSKVIAFIYKGEMYVTPYTTESLEIVRNAGYKLHEFYVPFSGGDKPLGEFGEQWQELVDSAKAAVRSARQKAAPATTASLQPVVAAV